jgi:hypothetical protein
MGFSFKTENYFFGTFILYLPKSRYERTICVKISESAPVKVSKKPIKTKQKQQHQMFTFDWIIVGMTTERLYFQLF